MDYHLKSIGKTCAETGEELSPGSLCYSALVEKGERYERLDFSEAGWSGPPEDAIGYWKTIIPDNQSTKAAPLDADALMNYFEQLCEDANPVQEKFAYVLSLLLLQKRRLKIDGPRVDGDIEYLIFVGARGEGPFEIRDQNLSEEEIIQLQASLNQHLTSDWT